MPCRPLMRRLAVAALAVWLGAEPAFGADVYQLTKDLRAARERYARAEGERRAEVLAEMAQIIDERAFLLNALISSNPSLVLEVALSPAEVRAIPAELRAPLEESDTVEGTIEQIPRGRGRFPYQMRDRRGRTLTLHPAGDPPVFMPGGAAKISGVRLGNRLAFRGAGNFSGVSRSGRDTTPPTVQIVEPAPGAVVRDTVMLRAEASDNERVAQVSLFRDGTLLGDVDRPPYALAWDTRREADGPHQVQARAHDPDLNPGMSPALTVTVDNTPPRAALLSPVQGAALSGAAVLEAEASDIIGLDRVTFLVDEKSVGVLVAPPYRYRWDTTAGSNGVHRLEVTAVDRAGNRVTTPGIEIRVLNRNAAPQLSPIGNQDVTEGLTLSFPVQATDPDGERDPLTYTADQLPPWATFDPATHVFEGTPDFAVAGVEEPKRVYHGVRFRVCDAQPLCDTAEITITVANVNRPPTIDPLGEVVIHEGERVAITPNVMDPDGDPLTCATSPLPAWARLNRATCAISGRPNATTASQIQPDRVFADISMEVCDPEPRCASTVLTLRVVDARQRPQLRHLGDQTIDEGKPLRLRIRAVDPDNDPLQLTVSPIPEGANFVDEGGGSGTLIWLPSMDQAGTYRLRVTAADKTLEDAETITVTVRETTLSISGTIRNQDDQPFAGATVELARPGDRVREAFTNANGRYLALDLPPGDYTVRPRDPRADNRPTQEGTHFSPLSRRVTLKDRDERGVDFEAVEN